MPKKPKNPTPHQLAKLYSKLFLSKFLMSFLEILFHAIISIISITEEILNLVLLYGRPQFVFGLLENFVLIIPQP